MNPKIESLLQFVYPDADAAHLAREIAHLVETVQPDLPTTDFDGVRFQAQDVVLITYADMVRAEGESPLQTLAEFLAASVADTISTVHLLPFYPFTSDDGFSVVDYLAVDPASGDWEDVARLRPTFRLMFDAVINHASQASDWFQAYLRGEAPYDTYFIDVDPTLDLSAVFRPRALPLLTPFATNRGTKHLWTTFSADQVDLNFGSPALLLDVLRVLLAYVKHGAEMIRLDAIGFMWKEVGTSSIHLPQTHALIQLMRAVLNECAPQVALITETNVPHKDNISYFGDGVNEAQMVYNFSLPPLTLHAFHSGDASVLSQWAGTLSLPSTETTFFNFLASHDGIGVTPARGLLPDDEIAAMAQRVEALGGRVSYKTNSDGSQSAYELNINYLDALGEPDEDVTDFLVAARFLASQAIMLALRGVPGIYFHSLFGSRGWPEGVAQTGMNRTVNRQKLEAEELSIKLRLPSVRQMVFDGYQALLRVRREQPAFDPHGEQTILMLQPAVFAVEREARGQRLLCLQNVAFAPADVQLPHAGRNLMDGSDVPAGSYTIRPYEIVWLDTTPAKQG